MRGLEQKRNSFLIKSLRYLAVLRPGVVVEERIEFSQALFFNFVQAVA